MVFGEPEGEPGAPEGTLEGKPRAARGGRNVNRILTVAIIVVALAIVGALVFVLLTIPKQGEAPATAADAAISRAEEGIRANPEDVMARLTLANAYYQYGFYDDALTALDDARSLETTSVSMGAYVEIGYARVYEAMEEPDSAREHYLAALDLEESFDAYYALGSLAHNVGDDDEAVKYWLKAVEMEPAAATVRVEIAAVYEAQGKYDLALAQLEEAVKYIPDDTEATDALERVKAQVK